MKKIKILHFLILAIFTLPIFLGLISVYEDSNTVAKIKTIFIYNFTRYIEWPNQDKLTEFNIGILGEHPILKKELEKLAAKKAFHNLPFKVTTYKSIEDINHAQLLYVYGDDHFNQERLLKKIQGKGILLIAENLDDFNKSMVNFIEIDGKIKFSINQKAIGNENFKLDNNLLSLAILDEAGWKNTYFKFKHLLENNTNEKFEVNRQDLEKIILDKELQEKEEKIKKLEAEKKENEHRSELKIQKTIIWAVVSGLFLLILFSGFVFRSLQLTRRQKKLIEIKNLETEKQKSIIEEKNKDILDSIQYARRIQNSLLPTEKYIDKNLKRLRKN